jgi:outer membrane protein assembly factor BamD (BamD/ComL family)
MQTLNEELNEEGVSSLNDSVQGVAAAPTDPETREYYLAGIPKTETELQESYNLEIDAYQKLGFLYLEELNDTAIALNTYIEFQKKYPDNKYRIESWYALYKIYSNQGDKEQAAYYKSLIISNYPESDYARVIVDPDYYIKLSEEKGQSAKLYERTYLAYENEQYNRVITYADRAIEQYPTDTALLPRFLYLRAISIGKVDVADSLYVALQKLIELYPQSEVVPRAKSVMQMLQKEYGLGDQLSVDAETGKIVKESPFKYKPDDMHLVVMILNSDVVDIDPLKVRISDFKQKYFRLVQLRVKSLMLDNQRAIITIGNFEDAAAAYDFYTAIENDQYVLSGINKDDFELFAISTNNYPILYREKNVSDYVEFFEANYKEE